MRLGLSDVYVTRKEFTDLLKVELEVEPGSLDSKSWARAEELRAG